MEQPVTMPTGTGHLRNTEGGEAHFMREKLLKVVLASAAVMVCVGAALRGCDAPSATDAARNTDSAAAGGPRHTPRDESEFSRRPRSRVARSADTGPDEASSPAAPTIPESLRQALEIGVLKWDLHDATERRSRLEMVAHTPGPHLVATAYLVSLDPSKVSMPEPTLHVFSLDGAQHPWIRVVRRSSSVEVESDDPDPRGWQCHRVKSRTEFDLECAGPVDADGEYVEVSLEAGGAQLRRAEVLVRPVVGGVHYDYDPATPNRIVLRAMVYAARSDGISVSLEWEDGRPVVVTRQALQIGEVPVADYAASKEQVLAARLTASMEFEGTHLPHRAVIEVQSLRGERSQSARVLK